MKKGNKGGKRAGSGRKPVENPKVQVTLYIDPAYIKNFGGLEQMKAAIHGFVAAKRSDVNDLVFPKPTPKTSKDRYKEAITEDAGQNVELQDATKPNKTVKPITDPKPATNYTVDTRPKTLPELKALCPPELEGFDRSTWIATERQKYGI